MLTCCRRITWTSRPSVNTKVTARMAWRRKNGRSARSSRRTIFAAVLSPAEGARRDEFNRLYVTRAERVEPAIQCGVNQRTAVIRHAEVIALLHGELFAVGHHQVERFERLGLAKLSDVLGVHQAS